jgi:RNA polymerase sigma-70 factor (ECF subfamily)
MQPCRQQNEQERVCVGARKSIVASAPEEAEWVRKAQNGDRTAFALLVDRYWDALRRWVLGMTGREHLAEDVTQEAFFRAWVGLADMRAEVAFRVWLFRIAHNYLLNDKRGPRGKVAELITEPASVEPGPLQALLARECEHSLNQAIARLAPGYRAAYLLWTQERLPYAEIAEVLATSEATARWRVCKARRFLLKEMKDYLDPTIP